MAEPGPKKRLALDTNLLLALAEERDYAHDFRERFQRFAYTLLAGPTVFQELAFAGCYDSELKRSNARKAISKARDWCIVPFELSSVERAICERFVERLFARRLLPSAEFNDALIWRRPPLLKFRSWSPRTGICSILTKTRCSFSSMRPICFRLGLRIRERCCVHSPDGLKR